MENKLTYVIERSFVETAVGRSLSDIEWQSFASSLEEALDYYSNDEIPRIYDELADIVSEDSKYD